MRHSPRYTASQARNIGDCAVIAIAEVTGLSWDAVWDVAQYYFGRMGLTPTDRFNILKELGFRSDEFHKLMHWDRLSNAFDNRPATMTVMQAEKWLNDNMPAALVICTIDVDRQGHAITYRDGRFHNTLGAKRARIQYSSIISKAA